jgi:hypothetical protein
MSTKHDYSSVEHFKQVVSLALEVDDAFDVASHRECTCGSNPEGVCGFCSAWERADKKLNTFKALVERGLGTD